MEIEKEDIANAGHVDEEYIIESMDSLGNESDDDDNESDDDNNESDDNESGDDNESDDES